MAAGAIRGPKAGRDGTSASLVNTECRGRFWNGAGRLRDSGVRERGRPGPEVEGRKGRPTRDTMRETTRMLEVTARRAALFGGEVHQPLPGSYCPRHPG